MGFPIKNDHFGVSWGYHHLSKLGNTHISLLGNVNTAKSQKVFVLLVKTMGTYTHPQVGLALESQKK